METFRSAQARSLKIKKSVLAFQHDLRDRVLRCVRHRQVCLRCAKFFENFEHVSSEDEKRRAALAC